MKKFKPSKNAMNSVKRQNKELENIFANHISNKGHVSRNIKNCYNSTIQRQSNLKKNGQRFKQTFLQRRYRDDQLAFEKMLSIISYQGNGNQNHNEVPTKIFKEQKIRNIGRKTETIVHCQ